VSCDNNVLKKDLELLGFDRAKETKTFNMFNSSDVNESISILI
jgi:hypothetical protein